MKNKAIILGSCSLILAFSQTFAQEDLPENYIPYAIEKIVDKPSENEEERPLKERVNSATIANSIFLYEGYKISKRESNKGFLERYVENLEEEMNKTSPQKCYEYSEGIEYAEEIPFEREMYSALGKTLIEKYKFFREIDKGIKKVRDATTIKYKSESGVKYRLGLFVNKAELGEIGTFLKIKNGEFDVAFLACQNEFESYIETNHKNWKFRLSQRFKTGANGDEKERETYFSIGK